MEHSLSIFSILINAFLSAFLYLIKSKYENITREQENLKLEIKEIKKEVKEDHQRELTILREEFKSWFQEIIRRLDNLEKVYER